MSWTSSSILAALHEAGLENGGYWPQKAWIVAGRQPSYKTVQRVFGSWRRAWEAAGYPPSGDGWTRDALLAILTAVGQAHGRWVTVKEWEAAHLRPTPPTIRRVFGGWLQAWHAAGFTVPARWQHRVPTPRGTWSREQVLAAMQSQARADGTIMGVGDWTRQGLRPTVVTIARLCGSYDAAVRALGLTCVSNRAYQRQQAQITWQRAFRMLTLQLGHPPSRAEWDAWPGRPVDSRAIPAGTLAFQKRRSRVYAALRSIDPATLVDPSDREFVTRYLAGDSLETIARDAGISRERVRQRLQAVVAGKPSRRTQFLRAAATCRDWLAQDAVQDPQIRAVLQSIATGSADTIIASLPWSPPIARAFLKTLAGHPDAVPRQVSLPLGRTGRLIPVVLWPTHTEPADSSHTGHAANQPIADLPLLSTRTVRLLHQAHVDTVADLMSVSITLTLMPLRGFGLRCAQEVERQREVLRRAGWKPGADGRLSAGTEFNDATPLAVLDTLSTRAHHCLHRAHIDTLGALRRCSDADLLSLPHFGAGCLRQVHQTLAWVDRTASSNPMAVVP